ncbi:hypothetical protein ADUPG1_011931 [Aduncisulcus paluster]|uniref:SSD domain-containing protein n=1 Tax=Aduncisulcus paluster TaxID=2918883 RepID=A0ABQ5JXM6_9EUKA|nr:hypothetical protein ADUPG1_011931 [Aduncisulcus paluster]|eukprot:gnl/Carplike_NY0171/2058_a2772_431.p1 GENE.gnl/Carplike_NY0171/2058_a2772_431~~gnl/Carplike_NY0171/2058_a2772_431.p1  ORF type:complete len:845 (+),score=186.53 gnl/Carplike_NY0171/2058_a2772_431:3-2537(+)
MGKKSSHKRGKKSGKAPKEKGLKRMMQISENWADKITGSMDRFNVLWMIIGTLFFWFIAIQLQNYNLTKPFSALIQTSAERIPPSPPKYVTQDIFIHDSHLYFVNLAEKLEEIVYENGFDCSHKVHSISPLNSPISPPNNAAFVNHEALFFRVGIEVDGELSSIPSVTVILPEISASNADDLSVLAIQLVQQSVEQLMGVNPLGLVFVISTSHAAIPAMTTSIQKVGFLTTRSVILEFTDSQRAPLSVYDVLISGCEYIDTYQEFMGSNISVEDCSQALSIIAELSVNSMSTTVRTHVDTLPAYFSTLLQSVSSKALSSASSMSQLFSVLGRDSQLRPLVMSTTGREISLSLGVSESYLHKTGDLQHVVSGIVNGLSPLMSQLPIVSTAFSRQLNSGIFFDNERMRTLPLRSAPVISKPISFGSDGTRIIGIGVSVVLIVAVLVSVYTPGSIISKVISFLLAGALKLSIMIFLALIISVIIIAGLVWLGVRSNIISSIYASSSLSVVMLGIVIFIGVIFLLSSKSDIMRRCKEDALVGFLDISVAFLLIVTSIVASQTVAFTPTFIKESDFMGTFAGLGVFIIRQVATGLSAILFPLAISLLIGRMLSTIAWKFVPLIYKELKVPTDKKDQIRERTAPERARYNEAYANVQGTIESMRGILVCAMICVHVAPFRLTMRFVSVFGSHIGVASAIIVCFALYIPLWILIIPKCLANRTETKIIIFVAGAISIFAVLFALASTDNAHTRTLMKENDIELSVFIDDSNPQMYYSSVEFKWKEKEVKDEEEEEIVHIPTRIRGYVGDQLFDGRLIEDPVKFYPMKSEEEIKFKGSISLNGKRCVFNEHL